MDDVVVVEVFVLVGFVFFDLVDLVGGWVGDLLGLFLVEEGLGGLLGFFVYVVWVVGLDGWGVVDDVGGMEVEVGGECEVEVGCLEGDEVVEVGGELVGGVVELEFEGEDCGDGGVGGDGGGLMGW